MRTGGLKIKQNEDRKIELGANEDRRIELEEK